MKTLLWANSEMFPKISAFLNNPVFVYTTSTSTHKQQVNVVYAWLWYERSLDQTRGRQFVFF